MRPYLSIVGISALLALCACAHGVSTIYGQEQVTPYTPDLVPYVTKSGVIPTIIRGNPFGPGPGEPEAIAAGLRSPAWYLPFRFTTRAVTGAPSDARLVLIFNPVDRSSGGNEVCRTPQERPIVPGGGTIRVQAALCLGDRYVSHLVVMGPPASSPQDPGFRNMMDQALVTLLAPIMSRNIDNSFNVAATS